MEPVSEQSRCVRPAARAERAAFDALPALVRALDAKRYGRTASSLSLLYRRPTAAATYDVVYCHYGWNVLNASMVPELGVIGGKLATAFHRAALSLHLKATMSDVYRPLFASGELFLPISDHWKRTLVALGCPKARIRVHRMGIDCDGFAFVERTLPPDRPVKFITVSRLVEKKGLEFRSACGGPVGRERP